MRVKVGHIWPPSCDVHHSHRTPGTYDCSRRGTAVPGRGGPQVPHVGSEAGQERTLAGSGQRGSTSARSLDPCMADMERLDLEMQSWFVDPSEIQVCRRPDGSDWLLGQGENTPPPPPPPPNVRASCLRRSICITNTTAQLARGTVVTAVLSWSGCRLSDTSRLCSVVCCSDCALHPDVQGRGCASRWYRRVRRSHPTSRLSMACLPRPQMPSSLPTRVVQLLTSCCCSEEPGAAPALRVPAVPCLDAPGESGRCRCPSRRICAAVM